ncbi:YesL family protein [Desnuesiella massiliensis]|uniref:YesL family protein n=1 Tax=Desnuesiella massiliensis TaxID=1650662 RepID=UPI0006E25CF3|nr:YesL family protein [Desnuesiella massiliensis]
MTKAKREFGEGPINTITNYILCFLLSNFYFLLMNIPLVYITIVLVANGKNPLPSGFSVIVLLCCIPIGPAVTALCSTMGKLVREKDIVVTKTFFKAYKQSFLQSVFLWALELIILVSAYVNLNYFVSNIISIFIYVVIIYIIIIGLYAFPIVSRFYLKSKDVLKLSIYYTFKKINITILNAATIVLAGFISSKISVFASLFIMSITCYIIMYNLQKVLPEIEEKIQSDNTKLNLS